MMFVDYTQTPVGPYRELLFVPGRFAFDDGKYFSISRIFVSSMDSVINGRRNWGIPKEFAEFDVKYDKGKIEHVSVSIEKNVFAELAFRSLPIPIPFTTSLLPKSWHTFVQFEKDQNFLFRPEASGWLQPARLIAARIDSIQFPPITTDLVVLAIKAHFKMRFPEAKKNYFSIF